MACGRNGCTGSHHGDAESCCQPAPTCARNLDVRHTIGPPLHLKLLRLVSSTLNGSTRLVGLSNALTIPTAPVITG